MIGEGSVNFLHHNHQDCIKSLNQQRYHCGGFIFMVLAKTLHVIPYE